MAGSPPPCRPAGASVSGSARSVTTNSGTPIAASRTKIPRHEVIASAWPPTSGANTGATPVTIISRANIRAAIAPSKRSRTTARAITTPTPPARPWTTRRAISVPIDGASAHAAEATVYPTRPASSGRRRPSESLTGPAISCPTAIPSMHPVRVSWPVEALAPRSRVSEGRPGRYMSIDSGPNADSAPRIRTTWRGAPAAPPPLTRVRGSGWWEGSAARAPARSHPACRRCETSRSS